MKKRIVAYLESYRQRQDGKYEVVFILREKNDFDILKKFNNDKDLTAEIEGKYLITERKE